MGRTHRPHFIVILWISFQKSKPLWNTAENRTCPWGSLRSWKSLKIFWCMTVNNRVSTNPVSFPFLYLFVSDFKRWKLLGNMHFLYVNSLLYSFRHFELVSWLMPSSLPDSIRRVSLWMKRKLCKWMEYRQADSRAINLLSWEKSQYIKIYIVFY